MQVMNVRVLCFVLSVVTGLEAAGLLAASMDEAVVVQWAKHPSILFPFSRTTRRATPVTQAKLAEGKGSGKGKMQPEEVRLGFF
jgi:hypothetical protein